MTGKEKCTLLKTIRREIAEANGIIYLTSDCTFEGDCNGTCLKCDAEIRYLDGEINRLASSGKHISLAGLSLKSFDFAVEKAESAPIDPITFDPVEIPIMGMMEAVDDWPMETALPRASVGVVEKGSVHPDAVLDMTIDELDLSVRTFNCLKRRGLHTVRDIIMTTEEDFMKIRNMGSKSMNEIRDRLGALGLCIAGEE